jgi:DNA-directed RNA polymerase subunit K/omega
MDFKKSTAPVTTVTRNLNDFSRGTNNVYESVSIIAKRSNQISVAIKEELKKKLEEFGTQNDNLDEMFENDEQIQISRYYERLPKPTLIATQEFLDDRIYWRNPTDEPTNKIDL